MKITAPRLAALREIAKILGVYPTQEARKDSENAPLVLVDMSAIPPKRCRGLSFASGDEQ